MRSRLKEPEPEKPAKPGPAETEQVREEELRDVEERTAVRAHVIHAAILRQGADELCRTKAALAWSGLAAGLSMSLSFVGEAALRSHLPDEPWRPIISKFGYCLGFILVVLGRQQLFTETTLTAILPLLRRKDAKTLWSVTRLWSIVLFANLLGAHIAAFVFSDTPAVTDGMRSAMHDIGSEAIRVTFSAALVRGIFAGWLIAFMVWLRAAVDTAEFASVVVPTYFVALGGFTHVIAGSVEVLFLVAAGQLSWFTYMGGYMIPTLIGNSIGGIALVTALNHAQVMSDRPGPRGT